ncbi:MAG: hypothetical protein WD423_10755 [Rhodothermales bacterium]
MPFTPYRAASRTSPDTSSRTSSRAAGLIAQILASFFFTGLLISGLVAAGLLAAGYAWAQDGPPAVVEPSADAVFHLDERRTPRTYVSMAEWLGRADSLRTHIWVSTGLSPRPQRTPLSPQWSPPVEMVGYTVQHVRLETLPGFYLFGTVYRPEGAPVAGSASTGSDASPSSAVSASSAEEARRYPAVLSPHGHWEHGRFEHRDLGSVPARGAHFARMGFVVLSYSMIGYNEGEDQLPHRFYDERHALWGFGATGLQLWNSLRALDFLSELEGVDAGRIGMTGASGGGTQTFLLTAVDDRIRVAAPVNMISLRMQGGCVCENAPLLRLDANNVEFGGLTAPRPLLMVSTSGDWTTATQKEEYPAMRSIYGLFSAGDRVHNVHLDYPHNYNADSRAAVYDWFARWLLDPGALDRNGVPPATAVPLEPSISDVEVVDSHLELPPSAPSVDELFAGWRRRAVDEIEAAKPMDWVGILKYRKKFGDAYGHAFEMGRSVSSRSVAEFLPVDRTGAGRAVVIAAAAADRDAALLAAQDSMAAGTAAFVVTPQPEPYSVPTEIAHWATYNATTPARRVDAIRQTVEGIRARLDIDAVDLVGMGEAGMWTLLARGLVDDVGRTVIDLSGREFEFSFGDLDDTSIDASDTEFLDALFVPGVRRAGDVRTAVVLTVPARLEVRGLPPGPFRTWLEDVYAAAGATELLHFEPAK